MRAWAADLAGRRRGSFCEQCGAPGVVRTERQVADRPRRGELVTCRGCSLLSCPACWPGPFLACRACCVRDDPALVALVGQAPPQRLVTTAAGPARQRRRARPGRAGVIAAAAIVGLAVVAGAAALSRPARDAAGVAGITARTTPSAGATTPTNDPARTSSPARTNGPGAEPSPSAGRSARPGTPAELEVTSSAVVPWIDALGELRAQVLVGVTNHGGSAGYLPPAATSWQVLSPDGLVVSRGRFGHVFPRLVEPGNSAWLVDAVSAMFAEPGELDTLRVVLDAREPTAADATEVESLTVRDVEWRLDAGGSVSVSGVVENVGSQPVSRWSAGVILVAADGAPLAAAYQVASDVSLPPGATAPFSTSYPGSAPIAAEDVATVVAVAVPLD